MNLNSRLPASRLRVFLLLLLLLALPACGLISQFTAQPTQPAETPVALTLPPDVDLPTPESPSAESLPPTDAPLPTSTPHRPAAGTILFEGARNLNALEASRLEGQFTVAAMQVLRIELEVAGGDLDYEFTLLDARNQALVQVRSDSPSSPLAINEITLPFAGTYTLRIAPLNGGGDTSVRVLALDLPSGGGRVDTPGAPYQGLLSSSNVWHAFEFDVEAGQAITLGAYATTAGAPDTRMSVYAPDGSLIAATDDIEPPSNLNAVLRGYVPPQGGRYVALVSAATDATGPYNFILEVGTASVQEPADIFIGQSYSANFIDGDALRLSFDGAIGDALRVEVVAPSEDLDIDIRVLSPYESVLAYAVEDLDAAGEPQLLNEMQLPFTGRFVLELVPTGSGQAQFSIQRLSQAELTGGGRFASGSTASLRGIIAAASTFHYYQFDATAGDRISLRVGVSNTTGAFDLGFALLNPDGTQLAFADDSGTGLDPALANFTLPQTGTYTVVVYALTSGSGEYQITLNR